MRKAIIVLSKKAPSYIVEEIETLSQVAGYMSISRVFIRPKGLKHRLSETKLEEISFLADKLGAEFIIIQPDLPPSDILVLRKKTGKEVIDRTILLLEVFEQNAGSKEAKLQIQVARMKHELPLLRELVNQAKRGELPGFLAGGAYAIDRHYRHMRKKVAEYNRALEKIRLHRYLTRKRRNTSGLLSVAIVGFANAGKTTLFNKLTGSRKTTGDKPFTTMSPKAARAASGKPLVYIDTVGFVTNVPAEIIDAFHATLEEITFSDVIVYVLDITEPLGLIERRLKDSFETLRKIGVFNKPLIMLLNKADRLNSSDIVEKIIQIRKISLREYTGITSFILGSAIDPGISEILEGTIWRLLNPKSSLLESGTGQSATKELLVTLH